MSEQKKRGRRHLFSQNCGRWTELLRGKRESESQDGERWFVLPEIEDREFWETLDPGLRKRVTERADSLLSEPFPQILLSDYREFSRNGNRQRFEEKYFGRRRMVTGLVLAECIENTGRYLDKLLDGIWLILEESTWCLPAHNSYIRDTPQLEIPDEERPVIDLFAAETAAILGVAEQLLGPALQKISPDIEAYLSREIRRRILLPYLSYHFWWMGDGEQPMLNWTPWITQNVLLAVFSRSRLFLTQEEAEKVLRQACVSLDYFLDEYGEDGCCDEGAQYYGHAGLCLYGCMDVLGRITGDRLLDLFHNPLIGNIAAYIVKVYAGGGYYFNFADCSPHPGHRSARDFLFGKCTGNEAMASFAAADYQSADWEDRLLDGEENLFYHLLQVMHHQEMLDYPVSPLIPEDSFFSSTQILIARDSCFSLAARGGTNGDSHNHNDVGSLILYKDQKPFLIDLGVETYTRKTFSDRRYEIWTMQSAYHNLPTFYDGEKAIMQKAGEQYAAADVQHSISEEAASLSMELAPLYEDRRVRSYRRTVTLRKEKSLEITDTYEGDLPCTLSLILYEKPTVLEEKEGCRILVENLGEFQVTGCAGAAVETLPIQDARLSKVWKHDCFRLLLSFGIRESTGRIHISLPCR